MSPADPLVVAAEVAAILADLGIRYVIGGSVASSVFGEPRSTLDVDLMIELDSDRIVPLVRRMESGFYIDEESIREAVHHRSSFNAIHFASSMKVDFFMTEESALSRRQLDRRRFLRVGPQQIALAFYSVEDLIVRKLMWFQAGGENSDRQWRDVVGLLKMTAGTIDESYLTDTAAEARVAFLLVRGRAESGS